MMELSVSTPMPDDRNYQVIDHRTHTPRTAGEMLARASGAGAMMEFYERQAAC
jgi:hypothetical protein